MIVFSREYTMIKSLRHRGRIAILVLLISGSVLTGRAFAAPEYHPIKATMEDKTVTLTGRDLTIDQALQVARFGAKVQLSPDAKQREADAYGLLLEAAAEGITIYRFNRGAGDQREIVTFTGDPLSPENKDKIAKRQLAIFESGARSGLGPEVADEDIVRAMMVVRANALTWASASPPVMQILIDLLNNR